MPKNKLTTGGGGGESTKQAQTCPVSEVSCTRSRRGAPLQTVPDCRLWSLLTQKSVTSLTSSSLMQTRQALICKVEYGVWLNSTSHLSGLRCDNARHIWRTGNDKKPHPTDMIFGTQEGIGCSCVPTNRLPRHQMCAKISFTGKAKASPSFFLFFFNISQAY